MSVGQCPGCGAPVDFAPGAGKVKVCEHCNTVVLRGKANLESLGKLAELVDTESPLRVGLFGNYNGRFTVVGRIQKSNDAGTWDEWCLQFDDGRTGWLSESEGEWNFMLPVEGEASVDPRGLKPQGTFELKGKRFVVEEVNQAQTTGAEGQLPDFNRKHRYVDATGAKGVFCTLDWADGAIEAFVGQRVSLLGLGFDKNELSPTPRRDSLSEARCTNCNGMLALKAPDAAKRVACPYCAALLDVSHGTLSFLQLLAKPPYEPRLKLGSKGRLLGAEWTVLAFLIRSCRVEGTRYPWEEYLLWNREKGFTWLMNANGHWTHLTPIAAGDVVVNVSFATWSGRQHKPFQTVTATTDFVLGECYWQVAVGEQAIASEFIAPPHSINLDRTANEVTFTAGVMVDRAEIQKAFGLKQPLPSPSGIAPAQPNPHQEKAKEAWKWSGLWMAGLVGLVVVFAVLGHSAELMRETFSVPPMAISASPESMRFSKPFDVPNKVPLEVRVEVPSLSNSWQGVAVDLVNEATGEIIEVYGEPSYYSGTTDGESWSEGSHTETKQTDTVDPGRYVVRVTPYFDAGKGRDFFVRVSEDDGPGLCCPLFIFLFLLAIPLVGTLRANAFETQRWNDSVFQTAGGESFPHRKEDDDDD